MCPGALVDSGAHGCTEVTRSILICRAECACRHADVRRRGVGDGRPLGDLVTMDAHSHEDAGELLPHPLLSAARSAWIAVHAAVDANRGGAPGASAPSVLRAFRPSRTWSASGSRSSGPSRPPSRFLRPPAPLCAPCGPFCVTTASVTPLSRVPNSTFAPSPGTSTGAACSPAINARLHSPSRPGPWTTSSHCSWTWSPPVPTRSTPSTSM